MEFAAQTIRMWRISGDDWESRWRGGFWPGILEASDEHLTATKFGAIECRSVAGVSDKFDPKAVEDMRGVPWQPPARHAGITIRTNIDEDVDDDHVGGDGDAHQAPHAAQEEDPENEEHVREVVRAQDK